MPEMVLEEVLPRMLSVTLISQTGAGTFEGGEGASTHPTLEKRALGGLFDGN